jgi:hypothetical protein
LYELVAANLDRARTVRAWEEVRRFLPYLSRTDRRLIEERLEELEQSGPRTHAACY